MQTNGINVASDIPYMPWERFVGDTSQPTGFDYDLSQALGCQDGSQGSLHRDQVRQHHPLDPVGEKRRRACRTCTTTLLRQKTVDFVDYAADGTSILVLKGNPKNIVGLDTLAGQAVGCEKGTTQAVMLDNLNKQFQSAGKPQMTISQFPRPAVGALGRPERQGRW